MIWTLVFSTREPASCAAYNSQSLIVVRRLLCPKDRRGRLLKQHQRSGRKRLAFLAG
jgi:hypothetical protein